MYVCMYVCMYCNSDYTVIPPLLQCNQCNTPSCPQLQYAQLSERPASPRSHAMTFQIPLSQPSPGVYMGFALAKGAAPYSHRRQSGVCVGGTGNTTP